MRGSSLLGLVGGPIGLAIGALALLAGSLISTQVEAEQAGKAIADGHAAGRRRRSTRRCRGLQQPQGQASRTALSASAAWTRRVTQIARDAGVPFDKRDRRCHEASTARRTSTPCGMPNDVAHGQGLQDLDDFLAIRRRPEDMALAAQLEFIGPRVEEVGNQSVRRQAKNTEGCLAKRPAGLAAALKITGDGSRGERFLDRRDDQGPEGPERSRFSARINAEAAFKIPCPSSARGCRSPASSTPAPQGGRDNLKNLEDTLSKSRDYYKKLWMTTPCRRRMPLRATRISSRASWTSFTSMGGDTSAVDQLANNTKAAFTAAIHGGVPVKIPVTVRRRPRHSPGPAGDGRPAGLHRQ